MIDTDNLPTMHIYFEDPTENRHDPRWILLFFGFLWVAGMVAWCYYISLPAPVSTITVKAIPLPIKIYSAATAIIPTGKKDYPAIHASGTLTIYNGGILSQELPQGFLLTTSDGVEVTTDTSVIIPAADPPQYGITTVSAHVVTAGVIGNIAPLTIDQSYGLTLTIRNLTAFTGGKNSHTIIYTTQDDIQTARDKVQNNLNNQIPTHLLSWCQNQEKITATFTVFSFCQYVTFQKPANVEVLSAQAIGNKVLLHVRFIVLYHRRTR